MILGQPLFTQLALALDEAGVQYLIVGGIAVIAYGNNRTTGDVDVWVENTPENLKNLSVALLKLDYVQEDIDAAIEHYRKGKKLTIYLDEASEIPVEFMPIYSTHIAFQDAWENRSVFEFEGVKLHVVDLSTLIEMKVRSGRPKDLKDVAELKKAHGLK